MTVRIAIMTQSRHNIGSTARRMALRAFGMRIRSLRRDAGHTQEAVAEITKVSTQTVRNWEAGRTEPSEENKVKLAEAYGVSRDSFLDLHELPAGDPGLMLPYEPSTVSPSRLLDARMEAGLTQTEVARRTGINRNTIGRYENGRMMPSRYTLTTLASVYGRELEWFLDSRTQAAAEKPAYRPSPAALRAEEARTREMLLKEAEVVLADAEPDLTLDALREIVNFIRYVHQRESPPQ